MDKKRGLVYINIILVILLIFTMLLCIQTRSKYNILTYDYGYKNYKDIILTSYKNIFKLEKEQIKSLKDLKEYKNKLESDYLLLDNEEKENVSKIESLTKQRDVLKNTYKKLYEQAKEERTREALAASKRGGYIINGISTLNQYYMGYPSGCESAALTLLLKFYGVNVNISSVVDKLPKGSLPYYENGIRYAGNPYIEFVGHPSNNNSYGTYDKVIENVANEFKPGIINDRGISLDEVLDIVKEGRPVIVWNSMGLSLPYISESWIYKPTGEQINWLANEHAILVVGFSDNNVIVSDSLTGSIRYFNKHVFENRYNALGKRCLYY